MTIPVAVVLVISAARPAAPGMTISTPPSFDKHPVFPGQVCCASSPNAVDAPGRWVLATLPYRPELLFADGLALAAPWELQAGQRLPVA